MQNKYLIIIMFSLVGCVTPSITSIERCVIFTPENICRCHQYEVSSKKIGRIGESKNYPISYCDKMVGFRPDNWATFRSFLSDMYKYIRRNKKEKSQEVDPWLDDYN